MSEDLCVLRVDCSHRYSVDLGLCSLQNRLFSYLLPLKQMLLAAVTRAVDWVATVHSL
jgi:hypothetical protein